jgi:16S rRNA (cytosine967-C5)-methyltransferase
MGVLRWRSLLDVELAKHSSQKLTKLDSEVLAALRIAAYQLIFLDRVPHHAAVNESVDLVKGARKRSAVPFANAVLRKLAKASPAIPDLAFPENAAELAQASAHPQWLVERWITSYGFDAARAICNYDQQPTGPAIRLSNASVEESLNSVRIQLAPGRLLTSARRVSSGNIAQTPQCRSGEIVIQDEASQLVALLVGHGAKILDCCAAPGGKARLLAQRNPGTTVVAAELYPQRAWLIKKLVKESNLQVVVADARDLSFNAKFDRVLVDVPCSGTGTIAHNPEIKWRLTPEDLNNLQARQIAILRSAINQLAPGGKLVYSTCSLESEENEQVVERLLTDEKSIRRVDCREELLRLKEQGDLAWADIDSLLHGPHLRTIPGIHPCEGFFAAILEKQI